MARALAAAGMTSATGRSYTFDSRADGYARSEACVATLCQLDVGQHRSAIFFGSAIRQDGRSASLTAPNGHSQKGLLVSAMRDAGVRMDDVTLTETHGTGTVLGDPIEVGSLCDAVLGSRDATSEAIPFGGIKANMGHAEAAAGMTGLSKATLMTSRSCSVGPNAQLRELNMHVSDVFDGKGSACLPTQLMTHTMLMVCGVSSFGYGGTIAHMVLGTSTAGAGVIAATSILVHQRRALSWFVSLHSLTAPSSVPEVFSFPALKCVSLVADHVVQSRTIFPGAAYLEIVTFALTSRHMGPATQGTFFLRPLTLDSLDGLNIECTVTHDHFEVRSVSCLRDTEVHCSGTPRASNRWQHVDHSLEHAKSIVYSVDVSALYDDFNDVGLQYGPVYRTLIQAWSSLASGRTRLLARRTNEGTNVHPADLDDALCTSALTFSSGFGETRMPFAIDDAQLQGAQGQLWVVRAPNVHAQNASFC